ncbi:hypothetical protein F5B20DRAFT_593022 [Whalleya microplaca]|nr:hypothetical protein F5B20DRAFT_593022 [Whalleya microplaca]
MAARKILQFLALRAAVVYAQTFNNGPFQLRVTSELNTTTNGTRPRSATSGFYLSTRGQGDYSSGQLTFQASASTASGPVGLIYDPGTNVAVPILNQTAPGGAQSLGFDPATRNLLMAGVDDSGEPAGTSPPNRPYNNWYLCFVQLGGYTELLVAWVLGANRGWAPTNPTCQPVNITMETFAQPYGGSLLTTEALGR